MVCDKIGILPIFSIVIGVRHIFLLLYGSRRTRVAIRCIIPWNVYRCNDILLLILRAPPVVRKRFPLRVFLWPYESNWLAFFDDEYFLGYNQSHELWEAVYQRSLYRCGIRRMVQNFLLDETLRGACLFYEPPLQDIVWYHSIYNHVHNFAYDVL